MPDFLDIPATQVLREDVPSTVLLEPSGDDHVLEVPVEHTLLEPSADNVLLEPVEDLVLLQQGVQGPPGPPGKEGPQGPVGNAEGAFLVTERLGELVGDADAQAEAQGNLGLGAAEFLAYYIIAKA